MLLLLVQASIFPPYDDGNLTTLYGLVNVTADNVTGQFPLPYFHPNGSRVYLGEPGPGYPPSLYPNLTYHGRPEDSDYYAEAGGKRLNPNSVLIYGPLVLDNSSALLSATTGIMNDSSPTREVLGWLTVTINASMVFSVRDSMEGLGRTGEVLIIGPNAADNQFPFDIRRDNNTSVLDGQEVRFMLPPITNEVLHGRHSLRSSATNSSLPFPATSFSALVRAWTQKTESVNNAGAILDTKNEEAKRVSVGYAQIETELVDWVLIVEQSHGETVEPINHLRNVVLICVFSVMAGLIVLTFPLAHYSVAPIRQLRAATQKTVEPYQPDDSQSGYTDSSRNLDGNDSEETYGEEARKEGFLATVKKWATNASPPQPQTGQSTRAQRTFRIPSKVPETRHIIYDELSDLTSKFNEMSDELAMQYQRLEERVKERTAQLEQSKTAAEVANQSKTLFIANISHELKTPLNGILGLAQICMNEEDPSKIKSTLNTIYKSGDLLLHLLTDLLTFSKNEVGQQLSIDESEFRLSDLSTQLVPTFERQAKEGQIKLEVLYFGTNDSLGNSEATGEKLYGPAGTGRIQDMCLWGDKNRILQVLMNFTSNSLKFTPANGSVTVRVRCLGVYEPEVSSRTGSVRKSSLASTRKSRHSKSSSKRVRTSDTSLVGGSDSGGSKQSSLRPRFGSNHNSDSEEGMKSKLKKNKPEDTKLNINLGGGTTQIDKVVERQRSKSPAPLNTKDLDFVFEVEDTGPGIPEDQQRKIFEPFVQGDLGLSKKYGGTGLGLSICAQLAALMGGELSLDSEVGRGSKFSMRIPLRYICERPPSIDSYSIRHPSIPQPERPALQPSSTPPTNDSGYSEVPRVLGLSQPFVAKEVPRPQPIHSPSSDLKLMQKVESEAKKQGSKVRVLVAEDNKINQEVVLRMLKLEDVYDVTIAKDGQEAYEKVRDSMETGDRFHLVFMDVQMPNVDGIQSTKMIRGMGFSAPIVALTAFAEKSNEDECMASGMDYFLAKPIRRPALKQVLKKYCATIPEEDYSDGMTPVSPMTMVDDKGKPVNGPMDVVHEVSPGSDVNGEA
ncbi:Histidine kinase osmosensor [Knufia obscura]|uniref:histidine kinase n=1 Tax=Knufia obscura TaxID=1635080 RepID=A0ABR0RZD4_9EURO|nr:Histidine kinase osmosensor [Knufia obscura]